MFLPSPSELLAQANKELTLNQLLCAYNTIVRYLAAVPQMSLPTMLPPLGEPPGPAEPTDDEEHPEDGELQDELANWAMTVPCTRLFALRLIDSA